MRSARQLQPGERSQIDVLIDTTGRSGPLSKVVVVETNDPENRSATLEVTALVQSEFWPSVSSVYFEMHLRGTSPSREVILTIHPRRAPNILSAESTNKNFAVQIRPIPRSGGKQYRLTAFQKPEAQTGYHFGTVIIKTTSDLNPEIRIPIRGIVVNQLPGARKVGLLVQEFRDGIQPQPSAEIQARSSLLV